MTAARLTRAARYAAGMGQRDLARRTGVSQSSISCIEGGSQDATVGTLERLAQGLGAQLVLIPSRLLSATSTAERVRSALEEGRAGRADVTVLQLADDLAYAEPAMRAALVVAAPFPTGDRRYDAWIAALVELRLDEVGIPAPAWVNEPERVADPEWLVCGVPGLENLVRPITPAPFLRRGVLLGADDLASVGAP